MTDLVIFVGIVALAAVGGILVGMIVAGRIDRILAPRPSNAPADDAAANDTAANEAPATREEHE